MSAALLAAALLIWPRRRTLSVARLHGASPRKWAARLDRSLPAICGLATGSLAAVVIGGASGTVAGVLTGLVTAVGARHWTRTPATDLATDPLQLAGAWDLLAACLRAGLPVATATRAVAERLPGADGSTLRRVAELLTIGADSAEAWEPALAVPSTAPLARAARRTARSGAAMADAVTGLAVDLRATAADRAEERAQRAGVLITGPLGLCFLPAFFCLGVLPVIAGLAGQLIQTW